MTAQPVSTRTCTSCGVAKPATREHFHAYKRAPDGCRAVCRVCRAADHAANRDELLPKRREHYRENKDRLLAVTKAAYWQNPEAHRAAALERHHRNRETRLEQMRQYRQANQQSLNERRRPRARDAFHERYGVDPVFTLKHRLRSLLRVTLKRGREGRKLHEVLGYSVDELRAHLERQFTKGMSWERFMAGEIHIDHIVPVAELKPADVGSPEFRACWALANLRPMWADRNLSKGAKVLTLL